MNDNEIVDLFWNRDETALSETAKKYGAFCQSIAFRILRSFEDAEECVNDSYLNCWNAIPPQKPQNLAAFLAKIIRNNSFNRLEKNHAKKRNPEIALIFSESEEILSDSVFVQSAEEELILKDAISRFLSSVTKEKRILFVQRYFYCLSVREIANLHQKTENNVKITLMRMRTQLQTILRKEGFEL